MLFTQSAPEPRGSPAFILSLRQEAITASAHFRPVASVEITPMLRTSGLLHTLAAEEFQTLLALLSFVTPNGTFVATLPQLADVLRLPQGKMAGRLARLSALRWQGEALVREQTRESGLRSYVPATSLFVRQEISPPPFEQASPPQPVAGREAVIAHSRAAYAHPRAEVEREMAERNGWTLPEQRGSDATAETNGIEDTDVRRRLLRLGFTDQSISELLANHAEEDVTRQLDWLPYRNARRPGPFLLAAIQNQYEEPPLLRQRRHAAQALEASPLPMAESVTVSGEEDHMPVPEAGPTHLPLQEGETLTLSLVPDAPATPQTDTAADP